MSTTSDSTFFGLVCSTTVFGFLIYFTVGTIRHLLAAVSPASVSGESQVDWKLRRYSLEKAYQTEAGTAREKTTTLQFAGYQYGRYTKPIKEVNVQSEGLFLGWLPSIRLKEWAWHSVTDNNRWFIGLLIVRLGFASQCKVYVMDISTRTKFVYNLLLPSNFFSTHSLSALTGVNSWHPPVLSSLLFPPSASSSSTRPHLDIHHDAIGYHVSMNLPLTSKVKMSLDSSSLETVGTRTGRLIANFTLFREPESLAVLFPLGPNRAAHTHKASSLRARGSVCCDGDTWSFLAEPNSTPSELANSDASNLSFATMDWTRAYALRETKWHWVCFTGLIKSQQSNLKHMIGVNASTQVYSDKENGLWFDEKLLVLGPFTIIKTDHRWDISGAKASEDDAEQSEVTDINLKISFQPLECESMNENFIVVKNNFSQYFGEFNGTLTLTRPSNENYPQEVFTIEKLYGVCEQHYSVW